MEELSTQGLEPEFELFVRSILDICDESEVKQASVQAQQNGRVRIKQFEVEEKGV